MDPRIDALNEIINKSQEEIKRIQNECTHPYRTVGLYGEFGHFESGLICDDCGEYLGWGKTYDEWVISLFYEGLDKKDYIKRKKIKENNSINIYGDALIIEEEFMELVKDHL